MPLQASLHRPTATLEMHNLQVSKCKATCCQVAFFMNNSQGNLLLKNDLNKANRYMHQISNFRFKHLYASTF